MRANTEASSLTGKGQKCVSLQLIAVPLAVMTYFRSYHRICMQGQYSVHNFEFVGAVQQTAWRHRLSHNVEPV